MNRPKTESRRAESGEGIASWQATEKAQLAAVASATPAQRLAWLEEAMRLAYGAGASRRRATTESR